jgi:hypothetical protein
MASEKIMPSSLKMRTLRKPPGQMSGPDRAMCGFGNQATGYRPLGDHGSTRKRGILLVPRGVHLAPLLLARKLLKPTTAFDLLR